MMNDSPRESALLQRLDDQRRALDLERRGIRSGARLSEINQAIAQIDLARGALTRDLGSARAGMSFQTRALRGRR